MISSCSKKIEESIWEPEFPKIQNMDEFRRSFQHNGEAFVTASFEESVIKSATIVKGRLEEATRVVDGYVIYKFEVVDSIKNIEQDELVYLYEPEIDSEHLLYQVGQEYVLILARSTDIYYEHPVFNNFGQMIIGIENEVVVTATSAWGTIDLKQDYALTTYDDLIERIQSIRNSNTGIKDGYYNFMGRYLDTDDFQVIMNKSGVIAEIQLDEILYENAVMQECQFTVTKVYKGNTKDQIIVTIPSFISLEVGHNYLAPLFYDANYTLAAITGFVNVTAENYSEYLAALEIYQETVLKDELTTRVYQELYMEWLDYPEKFETVLIQSTEECEASNEEELELEDESDSEMVLEKTETSITSGNDQDYIATEESLPSTGPVSNNPVYNDYYKKNNDFVGWISIEGTVIDYPVLQGQDNAYYLKKNLYKEYSKYGSISLDYRCDIDNIERNTMVFGHNMKDVKMFNALVNYKDKEFFDSHKYVTFNTLNEKMTWEVFSVYVVDGGYGYAISYPLRSEMAFEDYVNDIYERNMYETDVKITSEDKLLTLLTCSYEFDNARTIVHARLISREPWE